MALAAPRISAIGDNRAIDSRARVGAAPRNGRRLDITTLIALAQRCTINQIISGRR